MQSLNHLHLDEKKHVEEPFLKQLEAMPNLPWKVLRLEDTAAHPESEGEELSPKPQTRVFTNAGTNAGAAKPEEETTSPTPPF